MFSFYIFTKYPTFKCAKIIRKCSLLRSTFVCSSKKNIGNGLMNFFHRVGHSELIGVCETGPFCVGQGKDHWEEMMSNPRTPIAHWYQLQESAPSFSAAVVAGGLKNCMGNSQQSSD